MNQNTEQELSMIWADLVLAKYPTMAHNEMFTLRIIGASDWGAGYESEAATLFEQFIMIKKLKDLKYEDE